MSSSDNSFGWTDASSMTMSSSDDDAASIASSVLDRKLQKKNLKKLLTQTFENNIEGEDESVLKTKKRKSKNKKSFESEQLHLLDSHVKHESDEDLFLKPNKIKTESDDKADRDDHHKNNKVKRKIRDIEVEGIKKEESTSINKKETQRNSTQDEVDAEVIREFNVENSTKKKRKKNKEIIDGSYSSETNINSVLNSTVENDVSRDIVLKQIKTEESDCGFNSKKKRKHKATEDEVDAEVKLELNVETPLKKKRKKNKELTENTYLFDQNLSTELNGSEENDVYSQENKQKKKKKNSNTINVSIVEEEEINVPPIANIKKLPFKNENDIITNPHKKKKQSVTESSTVHSDDNITNAEVVIPSTQTDQIRSSSNSTDDDSPVPSQSQFNNKQRQSYPLTNVPNKNRISISERFNFEDENNDITESEIHIPDQEKPHINSKKINQFIECNRNCKRVLSVASGVIIGNNDDVWIVKCPNDLNHKNLKNMVLSIENKIKLKVDGQTYNGVLNEDNHRAAVLLPSSDGKFEVKDFNPKGTLTFRKKIPKVDLETVNVAIPPPSFVPLPETKTRHPLFGPDYKKRIKIPAEVAERLANETPKKKHKSKRKHESFEELNGNTEEITDEVDSIKKKKKRKRKHSESDEVNNIKRVKRDPEVWDSEKAIENSLFNF